MPQNVVVNGEVITDQEIRAAVAELRQKLEASHGELSFEQRLELRKYAVNELGGKMIVAQEARHLGLPDEEALFTHWGDLVKPPSTGEIRDYYRKNRDRFQRRDMIHAAHIVKNSEPEKPPSDEHRALMEEVYGRLQTGEDFTALASQYSDCPENGGDLGFFPRGVMVDEFDARVFDAPLNVPTPVFETPFGLHIAIVRERKAAGIASLEEVSPNIASGLLQMLRENEVQKNLAELRRKAVIKTEGA